MFKIVMCMSEKNNFEQLFLKHYVETVSLYYYKKVQYKKE